MPSDKQREANRRNAQRSTGPKTAEGKARSSANAITHGLTAHTHLTPETQAAYDAALPAWTSEIQPESQAESLLVHNLALISAQQAACASTHTVRLLQQRHDRKLAKTRAQAEAASKAAQAESQVDARRYPNFPHPSNPDCSGRYPDLLQRLKERPEGATADLLATRRGRDFLRHLLRQELPGVLLLPEPLWNQPHTQYLLALDGGRRPIANPYDITNPAEAPIASALDTLARYQKPTQQQRSALLDLFKRLDASFNLDQLDPPTNTDPEPESEPIPDPEIDLTPEGTRLLNYASRLHTQLHQTLRTLLQLRRARSEPAQPSTSERHSSPQPSVAPAPPPSQPLPHPSEVAQTPGDDLTTPKPITRCAATSLPQNEPISLPEAPSTLPADPLRPPLNPVSLALAP
jgi:hypothetical protein